MWEKEKGSGLSFAAVVVCLFSSFLSLLQIVAVLLLLFC